MKRISALVVDITVNFPWWHKMNPAGGFYLIQSHGQQQHNNGHSSKIPRSLTRQLTNTCTTFPFKLHMARATSQGEFVFIEIAGQWAWTLNSAIARVCAVCSCWQSDSFSEGRHDLVFFFLFFCQYVCMKYCIRGGGMHEHHCGTSIYWARNNPGFTFSLKTKLKN